MAEAEDLGRRLPAAPPPSPARREAAIEAALRRFDGAAASRPATPERLRPRWWANRPQLGALVAACLLLAVGLPLAIRTENERMNRGAPSKIAGAGDGAGPAPTAPAAPSPGDEPARLEKAEPPPPAPSEPETALEESAAPVPPAPAPARPAPAEAMADSVPAAPLAPAPQEAREAAAASAAAPPAPPPPPAMARARTGAVRGSSLAAEASAGGATAQKAAPPADIAACTIDDPRRQLANCSGLINPAAKGREGRAAAQIADGLSRAWQGDLDAALTAFDRAIAADPRSSLAYLNRGLLWQRRGERERAKADFDRAVRHAPSSAQARFYRGRALGQGVAAEADAEARRSEPRQDADD